MKISMRITLDGMLRALRWRAHNIAEDVITSRRATLREVRTKTAPRRGYTRTMRDGRDDRAGR